MKINYTFLLLFFLCSNLSMAQGQWDMLYLKNGQKEACFLADVTTKSIFFKKSTRPDSREHEIAMNEVALLFKRNGDFLVPGRTWVTPSKSSNKVIKMNLNIIYAKTIDEENYSNRVLFVKASNDDVGFVFNDDLACVIYEDGSHKLHADPEEVARVLSALEDDLAQGTSKEIKQVAENPEASLGTDAWQLDDVERKKFQDRALQRTKDFGDYLGMISDKSREQEDRISAIDYACNLFVDESRIVEVTTVGRDRKEHKKIRNYLRDLRLLNYDKVDISWQNINLVSELRKAPDGRFMGVITIQQIFRGSIEGRTVYEDVTDKRIEVVVAKMNKHSGDSTEVVWDVYLGNVGVVQTKNTFSGRSGNGR